MKRRRGQDSFSRNGADDKRGANSQGWLNFTAAPMGEGTSRLAYRCRVRDCCYRGYTEGSYLVFKVFKPERMYEQVQSVGDEDVQMQKAVASMASEFNSVCQPTKHGQPCEMVVRDAALGDFEDAEHLNDIRGGRFRVEAGQTFLLEREIHGQFEKFNSNSGWSSGVDPIVDAFSHWTWVHSGNQRLVCDCQGHRGDPDGPSGSLPHRGQPYYYMLTDPAICSVAREYGECDLGQRGIDSFFRSHVCNEWCEHLDIEYERPEYMGTAPLPQRMSTSYHSLVQQSDDDEGSSSDDGW